MQRKDEAQDGEEWGNRGANIPHQGRVRTWEAVCAATMQKSHSKAHHMWHHLWDWDVLSCWNQERLWFPIWVGTKWGGSSPIRSPGDLFTYLLSPSKQDEGQQQWNRTPLRPPHSHEMCWALQQSHTHLVLSDPQQAEPCVHPHQSGRERPLRMTMALLGRQLSAVPELHAHFSTVYQNLGKSY